jgi:hypothetical protein
MKEEKESELEEAKELFKEGLKKIFQATKKVTEKVMEGFREGYAKDVTQKNDCSFADEMTLCCKGDTIEGKLDKKNRYNCDILSHCRAFAKCL